MVDEIALVEYFICKLEETINLYHEQREWEAAEETKKLIQRFSKEANQIKDTLERIGTNEKEYSFSFFLSSLEHILCAQENMDNILIADLLEMQLLEMFYGIQMLLIKEQWDKREQDFSDNVKLLKKHFPRVFKQVEFAIPLDNTEYILQPCNNGAVTMQLIEHGSSYYLCSNVSPQNSARKLAKYYCEKNTEQYFLWGFGLGYEAEAILKEDPYAKLCVIEPDAYILKKAMQSRDLTTLLSNERLSLMVYIDERLLSVLKGEEIKLLVHAPSIRHIQSKELAELVENYYTHFISIKEQENMLYENFRCNMKYKTSNISQLKDRFEKFQMLYIGGGPSLDKVIGSLKYLKDQYIIVCAGTVAGKLLHLGFEPNYVIITDVLPSMISQIVGNVNPEKTDLLFMSTASREAVEAFCGQRYIIYQSGFLPAEQMAEKEGTMLFETGGSVSTTALDIGLRFGCSKILCMGLDLAYTDGYTHATESIESQNIKKMKRMREVKKITGGTVMTAKNLDKYRNWIEQRLSQKHTTELVNVSDGAVISGMKNISCEEFMENLLA